MKFWSVFWMLYMLFFCIPFPIFIYLETSGLGSEPKSSEFLSYIYLGLSLLIWLFVVGYLITKLIFKDFITKYRMEKISKNGIFRDAEVVKYQLLHFNSKTNSNFIKILLSFHNYRNVLIEHEMCFIDTKPREKRYDAGKSVKILLNPDFNHPPYFILKEQKVSWNVKVMIFKVLMIIALIGYILGLYIYFYNKESYDFGWRFLTFMHPIVFTGIMMLLYILIDIIFIHGFIFKGSKDEKILFTGRDTEAEILNVSQTGLTINDQPQVMFQLKYSDYRGKEHIAVYKEIISLLNIASIPKEGKINILYDEKNPDKIIIPKIF